MLVPESASVRNDPLPAMECVTMLGGRPGEQMRVLMGGGQAAPARFVRTTEGWLFRRLE